MQPTDELFQQFLAFLTRNQALPLPNPPHVPAGEIGHAILVPPIAPAVPLGPRPVRAARVRPNAPEPVEELAVVPYVPVSFL